VGVIAVSLMGAEDPYAAGAKNGLGIGGGGVGAKNPYNDLSIDMNLDPLTANKLRQLGDAKARAVEGEDYATAKQIKLGEFYAYGWIYYILYTIYYILYTIYYNPIILLSYILLSYILLLSYYHPIILLSYF
jgi:hypothetical protein